jgi:hypothetical protein
VLDRGDIDEIMAGVPKVHRSPGLPSLRVAAATRVDPVGGPPSAVEPGADEAAS